MPGPAGCAYSVTPRQDEPEESFFEVPGSMTHVSVAQSLGGPGRPAAPVGRHRAPRRPRGRSGARARVTTGFRSALPGPLVNPYLRRRMESPSRRRGEEWGWAQSAGCSSRNRRHRAVSVARSIEGPWSSGTDAPAFRRIPWRPRKMARRKAGSLSSSRCSESDGSSRVDRSVSAVIVADRGPPSITATSPKYPAGPSVAL